jgi:nucleoside-diphosphate-sugar epimerase
MNKIFWKGKKVLVTGDTGFKGSWLSLMLNMYGAKPQGISSSKFNDNAIEKTATWYKAYFEDRDILKISTEQIEEYY